MCAPELGVEGLPKLEIMQVLQEEEDRAVHEVHQPESNLETHQSEQSWESRPYLMQESVVFAPVQFGWANRNPEAAGSQCGGDHHVQWARPGSIGPTQICDCRT